MTMLSFNHFKSEEDAFYQCQMSDPDNDPHEVTVQSLRTGWTRNTAEENPDPPEARYTDSNHPFYVVDMFNNGTNNSFGVFGCNATKDGKKETIISTIRMRSDAVIVPTNDLFTQTVSINDRNVSIKMMSTSNEVSVHMLRWRKNTFFWGQPHFGVNSFTIDGPVQLYHAGIYECHVAGDRFLAKHGLNLLKVRACPSTRWGPPDCEGVCESCYNGGICDENTGDCVCAPGFRGENCLEACGGNRYGYACEHRCSYKRSDRKSKCEGILFCLVHPYGCRCNTGFRGLDCETECEEGIYGASCLESCHCASGACSRYTGECEGVDTSCDPGWTGEFCQECIEGYFGTACDQKCHCLSDKCNRESGLCQTGGCLPQWADLFPPYSCQTGLESANYTRGNPNVAVQVNCTVVQGPGGDLTGFDVVLSRCNDDLDVINITLNETFRTQTKVTGIFSVRDLDQGADLYCQLREKSNARVVAVLAVNVELYALPALSSAPTEVTVTNSSVTIQWPSWDENTDVGDPPIVGYIPYYRKQGDDIWIPESYVPIGDQLQFTFNNLDLDTYYSFSVAAVREGEGGEGSRSPPFEVKTLCATPSNGPKDVVSSIAGERQEFVEISWKV
ncbi:Angiopoietin-1 receptor [Holothuria leucospilota]|uniref:Angiopoietin-1 receptor n=1 Tax=Holothuria leucospilota TaxID=206669 RepID=A0A9Q1H8X7_HOLLE|nr:Angiopoietin-1 receptor [Holothuria leucospilota]